MMISCSWNAARAATHDDMEAAATYLAGKKEVTRYVVALEHFGQGRSQHLQIMYELNCKRWEYFAKVMENKLGWSHVRPETYQHVWKPRPDDPECKFALGYCLKETGIEPGLVRSSLTQEELKASYEYHSANDEEIEKTKKPKSFYGKFGEYIYEQLPAIIGMNKMVFWRDVQRGCYEDARLQRWARMTYDDVMYDYVCEYGPDVIPHHMETNMKKNFMAVVYFQVNRWFKETSGE